MLLLLLLSSSPSPVLARLFYLRAEVLEILPGSRLPLVDVPDQDPLVRLHVVRLAHQESRCRAVEPLA